MDEWTKEGAIHGCNAVIERGRWCYYCMLPFGHPGKHEHTELKWADGDKGSEPANLATMPEKFRIEYETKLLRDELAEAKRALSDETRRAQDAVQKGLVMFDALTLAEAVMSIVEPRSDKAEYQRILGVVRAAMEEATK